MSGAFAYTSQFEGLGCGIHPLRLVSTQSDFVWLLLVLEKTVCDYTVFHFIFFACTLPKAISCGFSFFRVSF